MHIVIYTQRFFPLVGGLERVAMNWAEALHQLGNDVTILTTTPYPHEEHYGFRVLRNPSKAAASVWMKKANVVLQFNISLKALPLLFQAGKKLIISHHTLLTDGRYKWQPRQQLKYFIANKLALANICCSHFVANSLRNTTVIHSPYDERVFFRNGQPKKDRSLLFIGRMVSDKGADLALNALHWLGTKGNEPFHLSLVGEGPERERLEQMTRSLGLEDKVKFLGVMTNQQVAELMNESKVLLVPSRIEPFGTVVAEGLACGCKVVCSNSGGLPEAAGGFGYVFPSGDVEALANAIQAALQQPDQLPSADLKRHLHQLTISSTTAKLLDVLNRLAQL
jgi:glycosyltransferase involved in cell wall biosynthesis